LAKIGQIFHGFRNIQCGFYAEFLGAWGWQAGRGGLVIVRYSHRTPTVLPQYSHHTSPISHAVLSIKNCSRLPLQH